MIAPKYLTPTKAKVKKKKPASMSASEVYQAHLKDYHHKVPWMLDPMRNFNLFLNNGFAECILSICSITIIFDFCITFTFKHALFRLRRSDFEVTRIFFNDFYLRKTINKLNLAK